MADRLIDEVLKQVDASSDGGPRGPSAYLAVLYALRSRQSAAAEQFAAAIVESDRVVEKADRIIHQTRIAECLIAAGERKQAKDLLDRVRTDLNAIQPESSKSGYAVEVAGAYVLLDEAQAAFEVVRDSNAGAEELVMLRVVGTAAIKPGNEAVLARLIDRIRAVRCDRFEEKNRISALAAANQAAEAKAMLEKIPAETSHERNPCLAEIGKAYVRLGDLDAARQCAETILMSTTLGRDGAAVIYALCGDFARAEEISDQLDAFDRDGALKRSAYVAYLKGDLATRDRLVNRMSTDLPPNRPDLRAQLIQTLATLGRFDDCLAEIAKMKESHRAFFQMALAFELLRATSTVANPFFSGDRLLDFY